MRELNQSRRTFLNQGVAIGAASWAKLVLPSIAVLSQAACSARDDKVAFVMLSDAEAVEFEAIAARIMPTTDTPGAREAGVIHFLDQTFATFNARMVLRLPSGIGSAGRTATRPTCARCAEPSREQTR